MDDAGLVGCREAFSRLRVEVQRPMQWQGLVLRK
jgi:hypothetical protein